MTMDGYEAGCDMTRNQYAAYMEQEEQEQQHQAMMEQQAIDRGVEAQIEQHQHLVHLLHRAVLVGAEVLAMPHRGRMDEAALLMRDFVREFYGDEDRFNDYGSMCDRELQQDKDEAIDTPF